MSYVVDASVVVATLVEETFSADASRIVGTGVPLHAPNLIATELGNAIWKLFRRGLLSRADVDVTVHGFRALGVVMHSRNDLLERAIDIATAHDRTMYDSMYLALADDLDLQLITADRKLHNAIATISLAGRILWIENMRAA